MSELEGDEFARAVRRSLENGSFKPIPHPDTWPENVALSMFDASKHLESKQ